MVTREHAGPVRVVVADPELAEATARLAAEFDDLDLVGATDPTRARALVDAGCVAIVSQDARVDRAWLEAGPGLQVVLKLGRNYANIDAAAVRERGMTLACVPRKGPNCVAELALTLILAQSKDLLISHRSVADGAYRLRGLRPEPSAQWKMAFHWMNNERVHEISAKRLGIVGMGEIGCELARRARALGMSLGYYKRTRLPAELEQVFAVEYQSLEQLFADSDYVCLAVPHTADTERMIGAALLNRMRPTAYLINICRGGVVDEQALIDVLQRRAISGAGLDVFTLEPLQADSPLCRLDNVILTPHIGGGTGSTRELELRAGLIELRAILAGQPAQFDVSRLPQA